MSTRVKRVAFAALVLACAATSHYAGAQSSDYAGDQDFASDDTDNYPANLIDHAIANLPTEAALGIPNQALDFALAQSPQPTNAASGVPARFLVLNSHIDVHPDGTWTGTSHVEMQLLTSAAVSALAQPALSYSESLQDLQVKSAYTLKRDGTRVAVAPGAILTRQKSVPAPYFTDLKEKVVLFPNVEPGDTLVYDTVIQSQARIPGQYYYAFSIPRIIEIDDETISFTTPKSLPLTFDTYGIPVQKESDADGLLYTVHYSNRVPALELPQFLSELDRGLRIFASSAPSYDALVAAYKPLVASKLTVTPGILAEANTITAGTSGRREQARKLYEWVAGHIRYVAVLFGDGGLVPHDADSVLANGYGDCKDHAVLYSALLKAKGIASDLVIINGSNGYILPQVPQVQTFNHMIAWLPEFHLYADTTSDSTPFGALPSFEYGKSVIRVGNEGSALQHTPLFTESNSTYASVSNLTFDSDGRLSARHYATASGAFAGELRSVANAASAAGVDAVASNILRARGMGAATGSISFPQTTELTPQYTYTSNYQFSRPIPGDVSFATPEGLNLVDAYSTVILGPVADPKLAMSDALPCFGGNLTDDYTIAFGADRRLTSMPQDVRVQTASIDYRSHWSLNGGTLSVHRELHAHFDKALCTGEVLHETREAIVRIQKDYANRMVFVSVHAS